jgi:hypothetical protein
MAWAIDRLGRSAIDLLGTIQTLEDLYLDQQSIDATTPAGRLMFQAPARLRSSSVPRSVNASAAGLRGP